MISRKLLVMILSLCCAATGCTSTEIDNKDKTSKDYEGAKDVIIEALTNKDIELFKTTLTDKTIKETSNLDAEIQCTFDMFKGDVVEVYEYEVSSDEVDLYGKKINATFMYYDVVTTESEYLLDMMYVSETEGVFEREGFYFVMLADYDREYEYFVAACPYAFGIKCGIFSSDIETIEFNEDKIATFYEKVGLEQSQQAVKFELNRFGIEKIIEFQVVEVFDWGGVEYTVVDSVNNTYYVVTDEVGFVYKVYENDKNGKVLYETI